MEIENRVIGIEAGYLKEMIRRVVSEEIAKRPVKEKEENLYTMAEAIRFTGRTRQTVKSHCESVKGKRGAYGARLYRESELKLIKR